MSYYFTKELHVSFEEAVQKVSDELMKAGFGILTDIDVSATFKKKLDVDFRKYRILGACHPPSAFKAISSENKIGTMLPCNVIVQEHEEGRVEITAIDPIASMMAVKNEELIPVATEIHEKLKNVIKNL